jgi:hypothetical protein
MCTLRFVQYFLIRGESIRVRFKFRNPSMQGSSTCPENGMDKLADCMVFV